MIAPADKPTERRPAIAYLRISRDEKDDALKSMSPAAQEASIRQWADAYGYSIAPEDVLCDDGISGRTLQKRSAVRQAIDRACTRHCALIFYSQARLVRNTIEALTILRQIEKAGAEIFSVTEKIDTSNVDGWFQFALRALLDERESRLTGERTVNLLKHKRSLGDIWSGQPPYGFERDTSRPEINRKTKQRYYPHLILCPAEQETIALARQLKAEDPTLTLQAISDRLAALNRFNRKGNPFDPSSVSAMLDKPSATITPT